MKESFQIGDTAYIVRHCPWWPSDEEKAKLEAEGISPPPELPKHTFQIVMPGSDKPVST